MGKRTQENEDTSLSCFPIYSINSDTYKEETPSSYEQHGEGEASAETLISNNLQFDVGLRLDRKNRDLRTSGRVSDYPQRQSRHVSLSKIFPRELNCQKNGILKCS